MTKIEELERRILLKRQLVIWTEEDIRNMEKHLEEEKQKEDEKPCRVWVLDDENSKEVK